MIWTDSDIKRLATAVADELETRGLEQENAERLRRIGRYVNEINTDRSSPYEAGLSVPEFLLKTAEAKKPEGRTFFCSCPTVCEVSGTPHRKCLQEIGKICLNEYVDSGRYSVWRGKVSK